MNFDENIRSIQIVNATNMLYVLQYIYCMAAWKGDFFYEQ